ncbi:NPC intracellular cholesterol transporter 1-like isoform X2 [Tachypleus tridentatus]|uniref:NPC intracellular cholesterol transporter 1-like isoform X2 n=1 Tax=Tachypleus tridentatus TaxID=6853 RepID=UPI003FD21DB5
MAGLYGIHSFCRWFFTFSDLFFNITEKLTVKLDNETFAPMNEPTLKCSESAYLGGYACSCRDCKDSCSVETLVFEVPEENKPWKIIGQDGMVVLMSIIFAVLALAIFVGYIYTCCSKEKKCLFGSSEHHSGDNCISTSSTVTSFSQQEDEVKTNSTSKNQILDDISCFEKLGAATEQILESLFSRWGMFVTNHPLSVIFLALIVSIVLGLGLVFSFKVTTDPVDLWVSRNSQARKDMEYFNKHFGPFYRVEQIIITPTNNESFVAKADKDGISNYTWGPVFRKEFLLEVLDLQRKVERLVISKNGKNISLSDICLAPLSPENKACVVQSVFAYFHSFFKRGETSLPDNYLSHILDCTSNGYQFHCLAPYGGPLIPPAVAFGGFENNTLHTASALVITFPVNNYNDPDLNKDALAWENLFVDFMMNFSSRNMSVAFKAERSIEDELERGSHSDIVTVAISYVIMFAYIAIALGEVKSCKSILVSFLSCYFIFFIIACSFRSIHPVCFQYFHLSRYSTLKYNVYLKIP